MADHPVTFLRFDAGTASRFVGDLVALQQEIYADAEPREFFSEDRYRRQLASHMKASGWDLVAAYQGDELVGYAYGFPLQPDTGWWNGLLTTLPDHEITETGHRTFALSELMVRVVWRGRGIGRALHDRLLSARREVRATLLVEPDNFDAKARYSQWGWTELARLRPSWEAAPVLEALVLPLPPG